LPGSRHRCRFRPFSGRDADISAGPPPGRRSSFLGRHDGSQATIKADQPDVGNPQWGRSGWIAIDVAQPRQAPTGTLFLNPSTGERSLLNGWLPLAWSPDGGQLLVAEATHGTTLAVVELPDLTKTRNVGVSEVGTVWDAAWLPPA
jgi:hypothetical protein